MRRVIVLGLCVALLAAAQPVTAQAGNTTNATNETVQELRERVEELEDENQRLENEKSQLQSELVSKNGQIEKLQFRLNQTERETGFSAAEAERLRAIGAWDPYKNEPAFLIWVESEDGGLYQYVGPGNGEHSFNGMQAWTRVLGGDAQLLGNITVDLLYAPDGIEETQVYRSTNALTEIRQLVNQMNQPETRVAWERWNNERRQDAETTERNTWATVLVTMLGLAWGAGHVESRMGIITDRRQQRMKRKRTAAMLRSSHSSVVSFLLSLPFVGAIVEWWLKRRHQE